ncbi:HPr kinase [Desulfofarcimen acetoxidans DSM 771]|uniref:HPr kinase n=1 Tax=Desulfofarcimen acetoxidans (strain ATCC 49208 / DSM 771 / KCTC 5769 / VKM B-1644 / 5575) TaxID=485916 RepID=C8VW99_DESAS|nr:HPr kinase [Desulfofarcimen acetoxidans]ACV62451.1 HPr kinase [Desulfofarcimen acetoxidans DSM 771]
MTDYLYKYYDVYGTSVEFCFNSPLWMESMSYCLSIPSIERRDEAKIKLSLLEIGQDEVNEHILLPGDEKLRGESILQLNRDIPYARYTSGQQRWINFTGYGRSWIDFSKGIAKAVRFRNCGISPYYSDIIFGYLGLINLMTIEGFYWIHASCVEVNRKGIVFTGNSRKGKSTAAYAMLRRGHPILSDDRLMLAKRSAFYGISVTDIIKFRCGAIHNLFPELQQKQPYQYIDGEYHYKAAATEGLKFIPSTKIYTLMTLEQTGQFKSRVEKIPPAKVVEELFPVTMDIYGIDINKKFHFIMDFLLNIDCYHVYFGTDMEYFGCLMEELVGG